MTKSIVAILEGAEEWTPAQDVAESYGIKFGATSEDVEPFFAELRELDEVGRLEVESILNDAGQKVGERLRLKASS